MKIVLNEDTGLFGAARFTLLQKAFRNKRNYLVSPAAARSATTTACSCETLPPGIDGSTFMS